MFRGIIAVVMSICFAAGLSSCGYSKEEVPVSKAVTTITSPATTLAPERGPVPVWAAATRGESVNVLSPYVEARCNDGFATVALTKYAGSSYNGSRVQGTVEGRNQMFNFFGKRPVGLVARVSQGDDSMPRDYYLFEVPSITSHLSIPLTEIGIWSPEDGRFVMFTNFFACFRQ